MRNSHRLKDSHIVSCSMLELRELYVLCLVHAMVTEYFKTFNWCYDKVSKTWKILWQNSHKTQDFVSCIIVNCYLTMKCIVCLVYVRLFIVRIANSPSKWNFIVHCPLLWYLLSYFMWKYGWQAKSPTFTFHIANFLPLLKSAHQSLVLNYDMCTVMSCYFINNNLYLTNCKL